MAIGLAIALSSMAGLVAASNFLVQYPINDWLTWGALTYPLAFLVNDLTNRAYGPAKARQVVYVGFALAVVLSIYLATPRIAMASGCAFLVAQLLDTYIFDKLRNTVWWKAPLLGSVVASFVDTLLFFTLAFAGAGLPLVTLIAGDFAVKVVLALLFLIPFRAMMPLTRPASMPSA
ncbi:VUT family protein [Fodinicurvata sp. EGI_FJ10296]|uniref:VUT family protein n=1 Tax=Fodinicurvata sp. EGI_FJ10296 TaxID=3231908 RepID=UPI0034551745